MRNANISLVFIVLLLLLCGSGCDDADVAPAGNNDSGGSLTDGGLNTEMGGSAPDGGYPDGYPIEVTDASVVITDDAGNSYICHKITCLGNMLQCGDCEDNDGDGEVDSHDRECLGPCDNTEGPALISGVGGVTGSTCHVDCYFDYGNGMGNDTCWWDHRCDSLEPEAPDCTYNASLVGGKFCPEPQDSACAEYCVPLTPNGCDCFGCCTFPELAGLGPGGEEAYVWIGAKDVDHRGMCTFADILDESKCPRCTPVPGCWNPCGKCEICIGKTTLPPECYETPDGGTPATDGGLPPADKQCPGGEQPCGLPGQPECPLHHYCISGCCQQIDIR